MELAVDRSSVSMGDDVTPHLLLLTVPDDMTLAQALTAVDSEHWLASVHGGATWLVRDARSRRALAVFRLGEAHYLVDPQTPLQAFAGPDGGAGPALFFEYELARDPELVHAEHLTDGQSDLPGA